MRPLNWPHVRSIVNAMDSSWKGSGMLVVEELEHAKRRNARIYAELVGYGSSCDASHITMPLPDGEGLTRCMSRALNSGAVPLDQVDTSTPRTSTQANDSIGLSLFNEFSATKRRPFQSLHERFHGSLPWSCWRIEAVYTALAIQRAPFPRLQN